MMLINVDDIELCYLILLADNSLLWHGNVVAELNSSSKEMVVVQVFNVTMYSQVI